MFSSQPGLALPILLALSAAALASAFFFSREARRLRAQLAAERQRTELVIRATQTGIFDWDVASNCIDYSERFKEILGFPLNADLSDRTRHFDSVHPEDRERAQAVFVAHLRKGRDKSDENLHPPIEYRMRRADGGYAWVRGTGLSLRGPDGRTTRYIASIIDISERKRQELESQNHVKFIGDLFDTVPLSLSFRDAQGRYRLVNRRWEQYFGLPRAQVIGKTLHELMPADLAEPVVAADHAALEPGAGAPAGRTDLLLRGRRFLQTRTAMVDAAGTTIGLLLTAEDVTERNEMQQALETQRQRLELVVRAAQAGIIDWDGATGQGWFSDRFKELLGFPADTDTSSWTFFDRVHPEDREGVRANLVAHLKGTDPATRDSLMREFRMRRADGSAIWVQAMGLSLRDESGRSARFLAAVTDISARRSQEEALRDQIQLTRDLIRALPNPLFLKDENFRFVHVNPAWEKVAAVPAEKALGKTNQEVYPKDYAAAFQAQDEALLAQSSGIHSIEIQIPGRNAPRHYILSKSLLRREDGSLRGQVGSMTDITGQKRTESQLRDQVKLSRDLIDANPNPIFLKDTGGRFVDVNPAWEREIRIPRERALGRSISELLSDEGSVLSDAQDRDLLGRGEGFSSIERTIARPDGPPSHYIVSKSVLKRADGTVRGLLGTLTDITSRKQTEAKLLDQIKLTRDLIDGNPNPVYLKDEQCRFLEINTAYSKLTRVEPGRAVGRTVFDLYQTENAAVFDRQDRELLARGEGSSAIEVDYMFPEKRRYFLMSKTVLKRADGTVHGLVGTLTDITQIKEIEAQLRENEERMRFWLENIPIPIAIYDPEGGVQYLNSAFTSTFGWTMEEMRGKRMPFVPEHRREQLAGVLQNLLTVGKDAFETERMTKDGRVLDIYISTGMARGPDAKPRATMVSLMDVTERKRMERELAASREEALQAAQAKAAFLAAMSHEIRTPLNGVLGMAGLLVDTELTEEQYEYVDTIRVSGDALLSVINDILDYSKIESGRMEVEDEPFEPMRAVEEALEILGERARGKRLELAAEAEDSVPVWVSGDFARLRQVLVNLVGNAVKFTERGEVVVRVRAPRAGSLEIEVSDTGIGISNDRLPALFQAFTQADASTTRKYGGTGLGLAISKRLVELMGGELRAESEPGRGSTFVFSVSVRSCEAPPAAAIGAQAVELDGRRILIVDDNATNLRILRRQLERWGAVPVAASGGPAALALLEGKERFDAALLDYHMPEMDGVMLARRIKAQDKPMPLVLLSSSMYRRAEEAEAGLFVVQLLKPVRQQQLREALVTALGGAAPARKGRGLRAAAGGPAQAQAQAQAQLRVLVVDDVDANCRLARALLRKFGHVSEIATSGLQAVEMAATGRYDVILMDVQMPDIDGMEATQRIHERLGAESPRIIAVTANALPSDRERCLAAGMDDYLSKPIQAQALRAAIEQTGVSAAGSAARSGEPPPEAAAAGAIDWSRIESLAPFDPDGSMVTGAIAAFLADAPGRIAAMQAAHAAADAAGLAAAAHALKGAAANIGAARLRELSQGIESLAREGRLEGARTSIGDLEKSLAEARVALAAKGKTSL